MKKIMKLICVTMVMVFSVMCMRLDVYAAGVMPRTLLRYESSKMADSGKVNVFVDITVQDSNNTIIGYTNIQCVGTLGVSDINVTRSCITNNNTQVFVAFEYYFWGDYKFETVYIDM